MSERTMIVALCEDYCIEIDGKPYKINGEKMAGFFTEDNVFKGCAFQKGKHGYEHTGEITLTFQEFNKRVKTWHEAL